jgi:hypothetical protein
MPVKTAAWPGDTPICESLRFALLRLKTKIPTVAISRNAAVNAKIAVNMRDA